MKPKEKDIIEDIVRVGKRLGKEPGRDKFSRVEYLNNGAQFTMYDIYDGGTNWEYYCKKAGYETKAIEPVPDEIYFMRLKGFVDEQGRLPKTTE